MVTRPLAAFGHPPLEGEGLGDQRCANGAGQKTGLAPLSS